MGCAALVGSGAADGLAVDRDYPPPVDHPGAGPHPRSEDRVELGGVQAPERATDRRLRGPLATAEAQRCKDISVDITNPLPDRGERPSTADHCCERYREEPGQAVANPPGTSRIRDRGQQLQQHRRGRGIDRLRAGRGSARRWHRLVWSLDWCGLDTCIQVPKATPVTHATPRQQPPNLQVSGQIARLCRGPAVSGEKRMGFAWVLPAGRMLAECTTPKAASPGSRSFRTPPEGNGRFARSVRQTPGGRRT